MGRRASAVLLFAAAASLAVWGAREFWFLTDDAFISFRYLANAMAGRGWVWNPAPFLPVEGYTNFGWMALLGALWWLAGVEPPDAANPLCLAFGLGTLALCLRIALGLRLPGAWERARLPLAGLVLLGVVSNRTYLTWLSSGLETSLFGFCLTAWIALLLEPGASRLRGLGIAASAAGAALTRPDGWLAVAGTGLLWVLDARERRPAAGWLASSPLALPFVHLVWRRATYGEWVPNTWFAKALGAWPESGLRYAASFILEYAVWIWLGAALLWLLRGPVLDRRHAVVCGVLVLHFLFYTLWVGGDHFEYRVYSHLVPLLFVSFPWLLARAGLGPGAALAALALFVALSWPIPWTHHALTRHLDTRARTHLLAEPVAPHLPPVLDWPARPFDALQAWLIPRHVGIRQREHAVYLESLARSLPGRSRGSEVDWEQRAVVTANSVGLLGWVLPHVAVLDLVGLNDWVIARTPPPQDGLRLMAHDRAAPPGYVACFRPNVQLGPPGGFRVLPRPSPLTDAEIRDCEQHWRAQSMRNSALAARRPVPGPPTQATAR